MFKKITVLAMALGAVAAFALPMSASAEWLHHSQPIQTNKQIALTGTVKFEGALGGIECQITSKVTFTAGQTTGTAEQFKPDPEGQPQPATDTNRCKPFGGLAFCQNHDLTPQTPLWQIHTADWQLTTLNGQQTVKGAQGKAITVTLGNITSQPTGGFCPVKHLELTGATVGLIADQNRTISSAGLNGILVAHQQTTSGQVHSEDVSLDGTLQIENPNANTYSIDTS